MQTAHRQQNGHNPASANLSATTLESLPPCANKVFEEQMSADPKAYMVPLTMAAWALPDFNIRSDRFLVRQPVQVATAARATNACCQALPLWMTAADMYNNEAYASAGDQHQCRTDLYLYSIQEAGSDWSRDMPTHCLHPKLSAVR